VIPIAADALLRAAAARWHAALVGITLCFGVRVLAIRYGWQLPVARAEERSTRDADPVALQSPEDGGFESRHLHQEANSHRVS